MDIELFWEKIKFTPLYKDKGMWVLGALVDSGIPVQLMIVSQNKADFITELKWRIIAGIEPDGQVKRTQYFDPPIIITNSLVAKGRDFKETKYMHKYEPYIVIKKHDPRMFDSEQFPDTMKIPEMFSQPGFTIKKIGV